MKRSMALLCAIMLLFGVCSFALADDNQYGFTNGETALRMMPSDKAVLMEMLTEDVRLIILSESETDGVKWYQVQVKKTGNEGYVQEDAVDLVIKRESAEIPFSVTEDTATGTAAGPMNVLVEDESAYPVLTQSGVIETSKLFSEEDYAQYTPLAVGDKGAEVKKFKERLYNLGYLSGKSDNQNFTKDMEKYIKQFQKTNGMEEDGIASAEMLAVFYSDLALTKKGVCVASTTGLYVNKGTLSKYKSGSKVAFSVVNKTGFTIDAFSFAVELYSAYGERYQMTESVMDVGGMEISVEDTTLKNGGTLSAERNNWIISENTYIAGVRVAVASYHTTDGNTIVLPRDAYVWYGMGKGVTEGVNAFEVTPLTEKEKADGEAWKMGVGGFYVDEEYAKMYSLRQGYLLATLDPDKAAAKAGLKAGDIILAIGDYRIFGGNSLVRANSAIKQGAGATVLYYRNGAVYATTMVKE